MRDKRNVVQAAARAKKYRSTERGKVNAREYRTTNAEGMRQYQREWHLKKKFGITAEQFESMLKAQKHKCKICRTKIPGGRGTWHIDHCHKTGKIRGLLCNACNRGIGYLRDDSVIAIAMALYLEDAGKSEKIEKMTLDDIRAALSKNKKGRK